MIEILLYQYALLKGLSVTLLTWITAGFISLIIGTICGVISCNKIRTPCISFFVKIYTFVAKGIPAYVQILIAYFVLPHILGISLPGFVSVTGALAFCSGGYVTEIVRSGINTVAPGQWDAGKALGYTTHTLLYRIICPQALRAILPQLGGELEQLLKSTSLLATVGITELTRVGMNIVSRELNPLPVYTIIAVLYLLITAGFHCCMYYLEKKLGKAYG